MVEHFLPPWVEVAVAPTGVLRMGNVMYDLCIVGAGLWGSAAARHAAGKPGLKVCLIGPAEPKIEDRHARDIFASHYDSGRTVRRYQGTNRALNKITNRSFTSLQQLQATTDINLKGDAGFMLYGDNTTDKLAAPVGRGGGVRLDAAGFRDRFPFLEIGHYGGEATLFPVDAGYVDPQRLVRAQLEVARGQGCEVIEDVVEAVQEEECSDGQSLKRLSTKSGRSLTAKKVLLCTGAFIGFKNLLPKGLRLDIRLQGTFTVRLEVSQEDLKRLRTMPTMSSYNEDPAMNNYILPPIKYPNGKYYLKIGPLFQNQTHLKTLQEVKNWFLSKLDPKLVHKYTDMLLGIVAGVVPISVEADKCVCFITPTGMPYCDMIAPSLGLAVGGNGFGAMMSAEIGRMAAEMVLGTENWNLDVPRENLKAQFHRQSSNL